MYKRVTTYNFFQAKAKKHSIDIIKRLKHMQYTRLRVVHI